MGCGRDVVEENGTKNGRKMREKRGKIPIFHSPISPIFPEVKDFPHSSLCKNINSPHSLMENGVLATHGHSPPRRLVRMLWDGSLWKE